ncbi:MAG: ABC transporter permease [Betaproteobacteria bacterium]|nr:ABC transporter permease [Betaproteobacteria bacterium]
MTSIVTEALVALRNLKRNKNRTTIALVTVACGLIAYMLAGGFIEWIFHGMREGAIRSQLGHIQIVRPGYFERGIADPYNFLLKGNAEELTQIGKLPDVRGVSERLSFSGLISFGESTASFIGEGIQPKQEGVISDAVYIRTGANLESNNQRAVLLGEGLAKNIGVKIGDNIIMLATANNGAPNAIEVKVSGTFYTASKEYDDNALRLPIDLARKLMRVEGATVWVLLLHKTSQTDSMVNALRKSLSEVEFKIVPWIDLADFYKKTITLFGKQISLIKLIIAFLIVLTISNTQTMSVLERTTEIGTMMAIGSRRSAILRLFMLEGLMLGIIGGAVGLCLGYGLATVLSFIGIPMPPPPGMEVGFTAEILVTPTLMVDAFSLALITTLLASVMPAVKASRLNTVDALRCNQ